MNAETTGISEVSVERREVRKMRGKQNEQTVFSILYGV